MCAQTLSLCACLSTPTPLHDWAKLSYGMHHVPADNCLFGVLPAQELSGRLKDQLHQSVQSETLTRLLHGLVAMMCCSRKPNVHATIQLDSSSIIHGLLNKVNHGGNCLCLCHCRN